MKTYGVTHEYTERAKLIPFTLVTNISNYFGQLDRLKLSERDLQYLVKGEKTV